MNVVERLAVKAAKGRVLKMWPQLRRWLPLLAILFLAGSTILKAMGRQYAADALESAVNLLGLAVTDPQVAAAIVGGVGAAYKTGKIIKEAIPKPDGELPPPQGGAA